MDEGVEGCQALGLTLTLALSHDGRGDRSATGCLHIQIETVLGRGMRMQA